MRPSCWVISSDKKGTIHQAIGIPVRLNLDYDQKIVRVARIYKVLSYIHPIFLFFCKEIRRLSRQRMPSVIISSGHDGLVVAAALKYSHPQLIAIHVQNPKKFVKFFDLAFIPKHDNAIIFPKYQSRVVVTNLGLHHLTKQKINEEREKFLLQFGIHKKISLFFSIGGKSVGYDTTDQWINDFCNKVKKMQKEHDARIFISTARRTNDVHRKKIADLFDGNNIIPLDRYTYNYYIGALAAADFVFVTCDSVSMISEACYVGKKIGILKIPGFRLKIFSFIKNLSDKGYAYLFDISNMHVPDSTIIDVVDDNEICADRVKKLLLDRGYIV